MLVPEGGAYACIDTIISANFAFFGIFTLTIHGIYQMKLFNIIACLAIAVGILFTSNLFAQEYKGASYCLNCHSEAQGDYPAVSGAIQTYHNTSLRDPDSSSFYGPPGVVSMDQWIAGLDLGTTSNFAAFGGNAPVLSYDSNDPADPADGSGGVSSHSNSDSPFW